MQINTVTWTTLFLIQKSRQILVACIHVLYQPIFINLYNNTSPKPFKGVSPLSSKVATLLSDLNNNCISSSLQKTFRKDFLKDNIYNVLGP